jgi:hypothetical protein
MTAVSIAQAFYGWRLTFSARRWEVSAIADNAELWAIAKSGESTVHRSKCYRIRC